MNSNEKITLFLMTYKGLSVLKSIISMNLFDLINIVVIGTDKNVENDYSNDIEKLCTEYKINKVYRENFNPNKMSNISIAISWNRLISTEKTKLIVLHESLLPKYRGFSPLVNQLINKEKTIGVTAIFADKKYDTGNIIIQKKINIKYPIKIQNAIEIVSKTYSEIIIELFNKIKSNITLESYKQNENNASYSLWRNYDDYFIDWSRSSSYILRFINSVSFPYDGAKTNLNDKIITIKNALLINDVKIENRQSGKVIFFDNNFPIVVCGKGLLKITEAYYQENNKSIFPLNKFRIRFQ